MTFRELLRSEREAMNWSREQLARKTESCCRNGENPVKAQTIKWIELGLVTTPRNGTRAMLCKIFPSLSQTGLN